MTKDEYCFNVCKAKCCFTAQGSRCPKLQADNKCGIYHERFTLHQPFTWAVLEKKKGKLKQVSYACSYIEKLLEAKALPPAVRAQCVYLHPELAEQ